MLSLGLLSAALLIGQGQSASSRLAVIEPAPDFALTDQTGKPLRLADLKGKVLLVNFIFTTCSGSCPATTHRTAQVERELEKRGLLKKDEVRLLSITLDPARDVPEVLRGYMNLYDLPTDHWRFLTGPSKDVAAVIKS